MIKVAGFAAVVAFVVGCGGPEFGDPDGGGSPLRTECCTVRGTDYCPSTAIVVQWDNATWSDRPDEVADAGACVVGHTCTVYAATDGGLAVVGDGVCH